ncbi:MAG TPA: beta-propeller fold lactonase family protein, partial [Bdellovibrionota bacterium]|nr:beta-propeller fold lactonase family protein [Bdellovibrionota bacterium]
MGTVLLCFGLALAVAASGCGSGISDRPSSAGIQLLVVALEDGSGTTFLRTYTVNDADGSVAQAGSTSTTFAENPNALAVSPNGRFAYLVTNAATDQLWGFQLSQSGALSAVPGSPLDTQDATAALVVTPENRTLHETFMTGSSNWATFTINSASGELTALPLLSEATAVGLRGLVFSPTGNFAYVVVQTAPDNLVDHVLGSNGRPSSPSGGSSESTAADLALQGSITPDGTQIFFSDASQVLTPFVAAPNGNLTGIPGSGVSLGGFFPGDAMVSPDG